MSMRLGSNLLRLARSFCNNRAASASPAVEFDDPRVQEYLRNMSGLNFDKVFKRQRQELSLPLYSLMTEKQLNKLHEETAQRAKKLVEVTPVLPEREERGSVVERDERLEGFDDSKWMFVDISMGKEDKDRYIVVREPSGTLRQASWEERDRLCQVYMPRPGRKIWLPTLLTEERLPEVLSLGHHLHVLNVVCAQCPPDSRDYIRVHHTVYEHIEKKGLYQDLHSTKHFGGLVWHLLQRPKLEGLITNLIQHHQFDEIESLINLYILCYPGSLFVSSLPSTPPTGIELIKLFCSHHKYSSAEGIIRQHQSENNNQLLQSCSGNSVSSSVQY